MTTCPNCRAAIVKSAVLSTSWRSITFACGSWDYFRGEEALQCGRRSAECRAATNTPDEPLPMGQAASSERSRFTSWRPEMVDERGWNVS